MTGDCQSSTMAMREVSFTVPWGIVAGKSWGCQEGPLVLLLHGIQDNCGTFDLLQPFLPPLFNYLALDFPGHGRSSHFQKGVSMDIASFAYVIYHLTISNKWSNMIIVGHSLGAIVAVFFTSLFSHLVKKVVLIDGFLPIMRPPDQLVDSLKDHLQSIDKISSLKSAPLYSREEAFERIMTKRNPQLSVNVAKALLERSLVPVDTKFMFSLDPTLKLLLCPNYSSDQLKCIAANLTCPTLLLVCTQTYESPDKIVGSGFRERFDMFIENAPNLTTKFVDGNHNFCMEKPEETSTYIIDFMLNEKCSL